jgi:hypothetical protein
MEQVVEYNQENLLQLIEDLTVKMEHDGHGYSEEYYDGMWTIATGNFTVRMGWDGYMNMRKELLKRIEEEYGTTSK